MRFGTKILLLTLAITLGLSGVVVMAVRSEIIARETSRAHADIKAAADDYFAQLDAMQEQIDRIVQREMDDPANKGSLDPLSPAADPDARRTAQAHFDTYLFPRALQDALRFGGSIVPAFHVLFDASGAPAVIRSIEDEKLQAALGAGEIPWRKREVIRPGKPLRQYLLIDGRLFLVFGIPIRQTAQEDPAFAYFVGFAINDAWARQFLSRRGSILMSAWFIVDGDVIARAAEPSSAAQLWQALLSKVPADARPDERHSVEFEVQGEPFVAEHVVFNPAPRVRGVLALASSLREALVPLRSIQRQIAFITLFCMILATQAAMWMSRRLARPVEQLVEGTQRIGRGDFTTSIKVDRRDELGTLARSFNDMAKGLAQRDLIKDTLGQFVDPRIADALITDPQSLRGRRVVQSILFSDLEGFTTLSERLDPEALVKVLNRFLGNSADVVKSLNGYLDKFTGDGVIAFWGVPVEMNHSLAACRAAMRMVELSRQFTDPPLRVRIGIATGEVLVGIVGSESSKKNYTAMGDVVNLASRIEGANKVYGTQVLVDARTANEIEHTLATRKIDVVRVLGRAEPVELHEVIGDTTPASDRYVQAMKLYTQRHWAQAMEIFAAIGDTPSRVMAERCRRFMQNEPADNWDGVWNLDAK